MVEFKRVGGLRFLRVGQFGCSWYVTKRHAPIWNADRASLALAWCLVVVAIGCL